MTGKDVAMVVRAAAVLVVVLPVAAVLAFNVLTIKNLRFLPAKDFVGSRPLMN
jgi:hypothetical protein